MNIKILLVEDQKLMRIGIKSLFSDYPEMEVIGEAVNGKEDIEKAKLLKPDIVLMDEGESQMVLGSLVSSLQSSACIVSIGVNESNHIGQLLVSEARAGGRCLIAVTEDGVVIKEKGSMQ
jgi:DNA-binding NarL/FixJ family response regulator